MELEMLRKVEISERINSEDFLKLVSAQQKEEILELAARLKGLRVVHVNATAIGGGVAEILKSLMPYLRSLGMESDWYCIDPSAGDGFFGTTNKIHNSLQGATLQITDEEWNEYVRVNKIISEDLKKMDFDLLVINDPQPLMAGSVVIKPKFYFSHIDTSSAYAPLWEKLLPVINSYDGIVFSNKDFVNGKIDYSRVSIFTPAIDPLAPKQKIVPKEESRKYLFEHGRIPEKCPLVAQISRFDAWKNPLGVIEAFRLLQEKYPDAHLAMVGFKEAKDNPAADAVYEEIAQVARGISNVHLFFEPEGRNISEFTVMTQNGADVIVQNSTKEGFGLTVSEAMWKRQPVLGGPASGIMKQITDGKNGFIVKTPSELSQKIDFLLSDVSAKAAMGEEARKAVAENFLFPRLVLDHMRLYKSRIPSASIINSANLVNI